MRRFKIDIYIMDSEFDVLWGFLVGLNIYLQCTERDEHVGGMKSHTCTIKERCRAVYNTLPFNHKPICMVLVAELV